MNADSSSNERLSSRRSGMIGLIFGMGAAVALGLYFAPEGERSAKVNSTLLACGLAGLMIIAMHWNVDDLSRSDRIRAGVLLVLAIVTLTLVDYGAPLVGRVATPLVVSLALVLVTWFRSGSHRREPTSRGK